MWGFRLTGRPRFCQPPRLNLKEEGGAGEGRTGRLPSKFHFLHTVNPTISPSSSAFTIFTLSCPNCDEYMSPGISTFMSSVPFSWSFIIVC